MRRPRLHLEDSISFVFWRRCLVTASLPSMNLIGVCWAPLNLDTWLTNQSPKLAAKEITSWAAKLNAKTTLASWRFNFIRFLKFIQTLPLMRSYIDELRGQSLKPRPPKLWSKKTQEYVTSACGGRTTYGNAGGTASGLSALLFANLCFDMFWLVAVNKFEALTALLGHSLSKLHRRTQG